MKSERTWSVLVLAALFITLAACTASGSSTRLSSDYLARGANFAEFLQLTEDAHGHLLGTLATVQLNANGKLSHTLANVSGAASGNAVTLVIQPAGLLATARNVSGRVEDETLVLNPQSADGDLGVETFKPSAVADFQRTVSALAVAGDRIIQDKATQALIARLRAYTARAIDQDWVPGTEARSKRMLDQARDRLVHERAELSLGTPWSHDRASFLQGQVNYDAGELRFLAGQVHSAAASNEAYVTKLDGAIARDACQVVVGAVRPSADACAQFKDAVKRYRSATEHMARMSARASALVAAKQTEMQALELQAAATLSDQTTRVAQ